MTFELCTQMEPRYIVSVNQLIDIWNLMGHYAHAQTGNGPGTLESVVREYARGDDTPQEKAHIMAKRRQN